VSSPVLVIGWHEFLINRRNRWVVSFAVLFAGLTLAIAYFGMVTSGYAGFQDFTRTSASLVNAGGFLSPLFALILGVFSFVTHPEYLELLVTQPVSRFRVLLGRYLGLSLTVLGAALLGFGLPGAMIAIAYLAVIGYLSLLALAFTGIALLVTLLARRRQIALGVALGVWIFYELIYGVIMLASTLYLPASVLKTTLLVGLLGNPVDLARVLSPFPTEGSLRPYPCSPPPADPPSFRPLTFRVRCAEIGLGTAVPDRRVTSPIPLFTATGRSLVARPRRLRPTPRLG
jgi:Cu-processing system permease protein